MVHFSDILMVLKDRRFKSCERFYTIDFPCCQGNVSAIMDLAFFIFSVSSIRSILFYQNRPNLAKVMLF